MVTVFVAIGVTLILYVSYRLYLHLFPPPNIIPNGKYVLISGCDTGFGHALAIELDKQGFHVLAGVYNPDNEEPLTEHLSTRATVFCLDVTQQTEIDAAYDMVKEKTNSLHALVNNAGIGKGGLIDWITVDMMRKTMDVNFFGHVSMTKKFLPLLVSRRGSRVINICSVAGYLAGPGMAAYASSKYALEAFSDCLRREMHSWGLHVSIIEPGYMRTAIIEGHDHVLREIWGGLVDDTKTRWGEDFYNNLLVHTAKNPLILNAENPQKVVKALRHAVMNTVPRIRYRPGWQSSLFLFPLSMLPAWIADHVLATIKGLDIQPAGIIEQQS
jgi:NAD(P)-dependent dehydrogenase (short-subunit alcohol dehydrogenase family)